MGILDDFANGVQQGLVDPLTQFFTLGQGAQRVNDHIQEQQQALSGDYKTDLPQKPANPQPDQYQPTAPAPQQVAQAQQPPNWHGSGNWASQWLEQIREGQHLPTDAARNSEYNAYKQMGFSDINAKAMVFNPQLAQQLLPQISRAPTWQQTGEDPFGNKQFGFVDPYRQTVNGQPIGAQQGGGIGATGIDPSLSGDAAMAAIKQSYPQVAPVVQGILAGERQIPTNTRTPYWNRVESLVRQVDPSYNANVAAGRAKAYNEFVAGGPSSPAGQITAGNTAIKHLAELSDLVDGLPTTEGSTPFSSTINKAYVDWAKANNKAGGINAFLDMRNHVAEEVTKFYAGSSGSEAERDRIIKVINETNSPSELQTVIRQEAHALADKIGVMQDRYKVAMEGPAGTGRWQQAVQQWPVIMQGTQGYLDHIEQKYRSTPGTAAYVAPQQAPTPAPKQVGPMGSAPATQQQQPPAQPQQAAPIQILPNANPAAVAEARRRGLIK